MSVLGTDSILAQLGVKPPYLLLDRIELDVDRAYGVKLLSVSEAFFAGHFPEQPIMPGVLQLSDGATGDSSVAAGQRCQRLCHDAVGPQSEIPASRCAR